MCQIKSQLDDVVPVVRDYMADRIVAGDVNQVRTLFARNADYFAEPLDLPCESEVSRARMLAVLDQSGVPHRVLKWAA